MLDQDQSLIRSLQVPEFAIAQCLVGVTQARVALPLMSALQQKPRQQLQLASANPHTTRPSTNWKAAQKTSRYGLHLERIVSLPAQRVLVSVLLLHLRLYLLICAEEMGRQMSEKKTGR